MIQQRGMLNEPAEYNMSVAANCRRPAQDSVLPRVQFAVTRLAWQSLGIPTRHMRLVEHNHVLVQV
jgi:hypothetical protein